jgi:hypothetical protein
MRHRWATPERRPVKNVDRWWIGMLVCVALLAVLVALLLREVLR